jgi:hypothetical protein
VPLRSPDSPLRVAVHLRCARQAAALLPVASQSAEELAAERAVTAAALESAAAAEAARRQAAQAAAQAAAAEMAAAEAAAEALPCELHEAAAAGDAAEVTKLNGRPMQACAHHGALSPQVTKLLEAGHDPTIAHIKHGFKVPWRVSPGSERADCVGWLPSRLRTQSV